jgi:hypothetical protein
MDYKLKLKIGEHEFEAEGPVDVVQSQFAAFKELIGTINSEAKTTKSNDTSSGAQATVEKYAVSSYDKIMRSDGRVVSLTVRAGSVQEAILVLLLGQRHFRGNDSVTGAEVLDGLQESGQPVNRVDLTMNKLSDEGLVITIGVHRAKRYRLSNAGLARAQEISRTLIATVP